MCFCSPIELGWLVWSWIHFVVMFIILKVLVKGILFLFLVGLLNTISFLFFVLNGEMLIALLVLRIFEYNILDSNKPIDDLSTSVILWCLIKSCFKSLISYTECETNKFRSAACLSFLLKNCPHEVANFGITFKYKMLLHWYFTVTQKTLL